MNEEENIFPLMAKGEVFGSIKFKVSDNGELSNKVEEVVRTCDTFCLFVKLVKNFVRDPCKEIQRSVITADRVSMQVVSVKDRESDVDQWRTCISHKLFTVRVTDHEIYRLSEEK